MNDHTSNKDYGAFFSPRKTLHGMETCLLWAPEPGSQVSDPMGRKP